MIDKLDNTAKSGDIEGMKQQEFIRLSERSYFGGKGGSALIKPL